MVYFQFLQIYIHSCSKSNTSWALHLLAQEFEGTVQTARITWTSYIINGLKVLKSKPNSKKLMKEIYIANRLTQARLKGHPKFHFLGTDMLNPIHANTDAESEFPSYFVKVKNTHV
jgi:hypothetical protein